MSEFRAWIKNGTPWIWMIAGSVSVALVMVFGVLALTVLRGMGYFWPHEVMELQYRGEDQQIVRLVGEVHAREDVPVHRLGAAANRLPPETTRVERVLLKVGNRDAFGTDFRWIDMPFVTASSAPDDLVTIERREWGNAYGYLRSVKEQGNEITSGPAAWLALKAQVGRATEIYDQIQSIERGELGKINYALEEIRLEQRRLELDNALTPAADAQLAQQRSALESRSRDLEQQLAALYVDLQRYSYVLELMDGRLVELPVAKVVRVFRPNDMSLPAKLVHYGTKLREFVADEPRESNTEGGIFPAIFGTVLLVLLMSIFVTPMGVVAAVYLHEYARQGFLTRIIRVAVNNLAGVPSIVYGLFGLGFFVYFLGGNIDRLFFPEALPSPTFGTGGVLWSALTLSILTLPVVIVATEEGLSRIPRAIREGSLALGATKIETLWRTVIPMASPAIMTGLILAVARAAGEVAPLMLVGVVKLAPSLPLDGNAPFIHLDRKFMHLGFHIYDVGFQSPNVEAARPLVYATALLLVVIAVALNIAAIGLRNRLREKFKNLEG